MDQYQEPYIPEYQPGTQGLINCLDEFLKKNYEHLHFSQHKTKRGSVGFVAQYKEGSNISLFTYRDYDQKLMFELYWQESDPSRRYASIKIPANSEDEYENSMDFISGALPVLSDTTIEHSEMSNEDLEDNLKEILLQAGIMGGLVAVEGYRGKDDEEMPGERNISYHEKEMSNDEILTLIDDALDKRDFGEASRLRGLLKESYNALKHIKGFENF